MDAGSASTKKPGVVSPETEALGAFIAAASNTELPGEVVDKAKLHILDTFAAMLSGSRLTAGRKAAAYTAPRDGQGPCTVIGTRIRCGPIEAGLANGLSAHADETDDSHFTSRTHPGAAIIPAALAMAEARKTSGREFLRAVTVGYDVGTRLVHALDMRGFAALNRSPHSFGGTFGAGAAAAALARLTPRQARHVLSYCAQLASGCGSYMADGGHIEKAFVYAGKSAHSGLMAVSLVECGFTASDDALSGDRNFLDAYAATATRPALVDRLGSHFAIISTNIKKWCVGSPIQSALDGVERLLDEHAPLLSDINRIRIRLAPDQAKTVDSRPMPNVNLQHLVALLLVDGSLGFAASHDPARMSDAAIVQMRDRVDLVADEALAGRKPPRQAIVELTLSNGAVLSTHVLAVRGSADNPMSRREVEAKARDLIEPVIGRDSAAALIAAVATLELAPDLRSISSLVACDEAIL